jgi:hypothetical protein
MEINNNIRDAQSKIQNLKFTSVSPSSSIERRVERAVIIKQPLSAKNNNFSSNTERKSNERDILSV